MWISIKVKYHLEQYIIEKAKSIFYRKFILIRGPILSYYNLIDSKMQPTQVKKSPITGGKKIINSTVMQREKPFNNSQTG